MRAVAPPRPASTSSKTTVPAPPAPAATVMSASITRESSPPEAISRSGPGGTPGFGAIRNSTSSPPVAAYRASGSPSAPERPVTRTSKRASSIATSSSSAATASARPPAPRPRASASSDASCSTLLARGHELVLEAAPSRHRRSRAGRARRGTAPRVRARTRRSRRACARDAHTARAALPPARDAPGPPRARRDTRAPRRPCPAAHIRASRRAPRASAGRGRRRSPGRALPRRGRAARPLPPRRSRPPGRCAAIAASAAARRVSTEASRDRSRSRSAFSSSVGATASISSISNSSRSRSRSRMPRRSRRSSSSRPIARPRRRACSKRLRRASCSLAAVGVEDLQLSRGENQSRCSCWPKNASRRAPTAASSAAVTERPWRYARVRPAAVTRRASTSSSESSGSRSRQRGKLGIAGNRLGHREDALDIGLLGARADDAPARLAAEQQIECVRQHRLAGAGLAGDHVQARTEHQLGRLDQQEVLDAQLGEHAAQLTSQTRRTSSRLRREGASRGALSRPGPPARPAPQLTS